MNDLSIHIQLTPGTVAKGARGGDLFAPGHLICAVPAETHFSKWPAPASLPPSEAIVRGESHLNRRPAYDRVHRGRDRAQFLATLMAWTVL